MTVLAAVAALFGINPLQLAIRGGLLLAALAALAIGYLVFVEHERQIGWDRALTGVEKTNDTAVAGARKLQGNADACYRDGGVWSVITRDCTMEVSK